MTKPAARKTQPASSAFEGGWTSTERTASRGPLSRSSQREILLSKATAYHAPHASASRAVPLRFGAASCTRASRAVGERRRHDQLGRHGLSRSFGYRYANDLIWSGGRVRVHLPDARLHRRWTSGAVRRDQSATPARRPHMAILGRLRPASLRRERDPLGRCRRERTRRAVDANFSSTQVWEILTNSPHSGVRHCGITPRHHSVRRMYGRVRAVRRVSGVRGRAADLRR